MATVAKFYLLDATSPDSGTLPSGSTAYIAGGTSSDAATGFGTNRDATDVAGTSDPDVEASITAVANTIAQILWMRRYISRPLAAHTFASGDGNWTFSYARSESNLNHNQSIRLDIYAWRPSTGARVGTGALTLNGTEPTAAATEQAESITGAWNATSVTINDGDILVFEIVDSFTQSMATAYTSQFAYNGTTEASTTTCATFVTPPTALTLFAAGLPFDDRRRARNTLLRL